MKSAVLLGGILDDPVQFLQARGPNLGPAAGEQGRGGRGVFGEAVHHLAWAVAAGSTACRVSDAGAPMNRLFSHTRRLIMNGSIKLGQFMI